jgi:hypothetical protein
MGVEFLEVYAGMAALTWRLAGGVPPLPYQGGKRAYAPALLDIMGVRAEDVERVTLVEASGPVAATLALWFGGRDRLEAAGEVWRAWAGPEEEQRERWRAFAAEGRAGWWDTASDYDAAVRWSWMRPRCVPMRQPQTGSPGDWLPSGHSSNARRQWRRDCPADRIPKAPAPPWPVEVVCALASEVAPRAGAVVYLDPPYHGTKGYAVAACDRPEVVAERWASAGSAAWISECRPLSLRAVQVPRSGARGRNLAAHTGEWITPVGAGEVLW